MRTFLGLIALICLVMSYFALGWAIGAWSTGDIWGAALFGDCAVVVLVSSLYG